MGTSLSIYKGAWTYDYRAVYIGTSLSIYKGALSCCKVHRGYYIGTSSMFLDLILYISFTSSFRIFIIFTSY